MKFSFIFCFLSILHLSASVYSQKTMFTLVSEDQSVKEILNVIENQSEFRFFYNDKFVDMNRITTVKVNNQNIYDILNQLFKDTPITYQVLENNLIVITPREMMAQGISITGKVTDEFGDPMPGVNITVKGTVTGVVSNINGQFTINVPNEDAVLMFSFIGYMTVEIPVNNQRTVDVQLNVDTQELEEVVVVGYGTMRKSDLTGSITSVSSEQLNAFPAIGISQALQGRAAGVQITALNGAPGADTRIRIRGTTSLTANNDPLWVVDGFPGAQAPNPEDIESIEILKDAAATAIYGSRGANGVILVTTKSGKVGRARVELNSSYGIETVSKKLDLLNASEYGQYINEIDVNAGVANPRYQNWSTLGEGTDWQDLVFRTGYRQSHQLSVSGGTDQLKSYTSLNFYDTDGVIINNNYKRFSAMTNLEYNVKDRLKVGASLRYSRSINKGVLTQEGSGGVTNSGVVSSALRFEPTTGVYLDDGSYTVSTQSDPLDNPVAIAKEREQERINDRFQGNVSGELKIIDGLTFTTRLNISLTNDRDGIYYPTTLNLGKTYNGQAELQTWKNTKIANENFFNYSFNFNKHRFDAVAGYSWEKQQNTNWKTTVRNFTTDQFTWWNLASGSQPQPNESNFSEWVMAAFFGRLNYSFDSRYIFSFNARYDGASRLGANTKWGFFPSGAFAWNIHQEQFMQSIPFLSQLKLRVSYGVTGNSEVDIYSSLARLETVTTSINEQLQGGVRPKRDNVANDDLSWEETHTTNIGLDIGFFRNRVNVTAEYYIKKTKDQLYKFPLPGYTGLLTATSNIGDTENKGFELNINTVNFSREFYWSTNFNLALNKNKVTSLPVSQDVGVLENRKPGHITDFTETHILKEGLPIGSFYGYIYDGVNPDDGSAILRDIAGRDADNNLVYTPDGEVKPGDDRTVIGNPHPKFTFGFDNTFSYKNFDLNIFFQGVVGNDMYNFTRMEMEWLSGKTNQMASVKNRWTPTNTNTDIPKASNTNSASSSSRWIEKGTYVRLQNVALGYNIQLKALQSIGIERFRVYVSGQNLLTFTDYSGYDPEVGYRNNNTTISCDYGSYPRTRTVTFGLQLAF